jgi:hypothetical protein
MPEKLTIYNAEMPKIVPGSRGNIEIRYIEDSNHYFLYVNGAQWMVTSSDFSHSKDTLHSQFDLAYGDVLITGLGFGILAKALVQKEEVKSITVIEVSSDVIDQYISTNGLDEKLIIINEDASSYSSNRKYDCLLPDHYETQDNDWKLSDMDALAKRINHDVFWPWSIEEIFLRKCYSTHQQESLPEDFYKEWLSFCQQYLSSHPTLVGITEEKLGEYLGKYKKYPYSI